MSVSEAESAKPPIAVLVVHGIGAQKPGETVGKLIAGLSRVERDFGTNGHDDVLTLGGQPVRFYEVYWADLLTGAACRDAFNIQEMQSISWFPLLNLLRRNYPKKTWSFLKLAWCALPLINFLMLFGYFGAGLIAELIKGTRDRIRRLPLARHDVRSARMKVLQDILDEYIGDVFSYVNSAGKAFHREKNEPPVSPAMEGVHGQIMQRFYDQLVKAQAGGCAAIHVVAHSLGTVVTYHALSGLGFDGEGRADAAAIRAACANVRHVYTIGSPLEKIRFFWPRLTPDGPLLGGAKIEWDNFRSYFDPVAGRLRQVAEWGEMRNHGLLGGGFFRGHVVYEHSPVFLAALTRGLVGREIPLERTPKERRRDFFVLLGETLLAPVVVIAVLLIGAAIFAATAVLLPFVVSLVLRWFLPPETAIVKTGFFIMLGMLALVFSVAPAIRAWTAHSRYWLKKR
jgi:hypothetical protein